MQPSTQSKSFSTITDGNDVCNEMKKYGFQCPSSFRDLSELQVQQIMESYKAFKNEPKQFYEKIANDYQNQLRKDKESLEEAEEWVQQIGENLNQQCPLSTNIIPRGVWQKEILYDLPLPNSKQLKRGMRGSVGQIVYVPTVLTALFAFPWQIVTGDNSQPPVKFNDLDWLMSPKEIANLQLLQPCQTTATDIAFLQRSINELFGVMTEYQGFLGTERIITFGSNVNKICGNSLYGIMENPNVDALSFLLFMYNLLGVPPTLFQWATRKAIPVLSMSIATSNQQQQNTELEKSIVHNDATIINDITYRYINNDLRQTIEYGWQPARMYPNIPLSEETRIFTVDDVYNYPDLLSAMNAMRVRQLSTYYSNQLKQQTKSTKSNTQSPSVEIFSLTSYPSLFTIQLNRSLRSPLVIPPMLKLKGWSTMNVGDNFEQSVGVNALYFLRAAICHGCLFIVDPHSIYQNSTPIWYFYSISQNPQEPGQPIFKQLDKEFTKQLEKQELLDTVTEEASFIDRTTMLPKNYLAYLFYNAEILLYQKDREY